MGTGRKLCAPARGGRGDADVLSTPRPQVGGVTGTRAAPGIIPRPITPIARVGANRRGAISCGAEGGLGDVRMAVEARWSHVRRRARAPQGADWVRGGVITNNIITIDIDITFNNGAGTCTSHAGADVTSTTAPIPKESLSRDP